MTPFKMYSIVAAGGLMFGSSLASGQFSIALAGVALIVAGWQS